MIKLKDILTEAHTKEKLIESGRFKLSGASEMQWGGNKIVIMAGNKKIVLTKKELYNLLRGVKMHRLGEGKLDEDFGYSIKQLPSFSSKEAKKIVDDGLRLWAKDLRKVEYRVIKDWLSKAKSGVIDYFDVVRGLQVGDASRAHPEETTFFKALIDKDKIMNRFRSYFKGRKGMKGRK